MATRDQLHAPNPGALRAREEHLRDVTNELPCVVFLAHFESPEALPQYSFVSAGAKQLLGIDPDVILRNPRARFDTVDPEDRRWLPASIRDAARSGEPWHAEFRVRVAGELRWLEGRARFRRLHDGSGFASGYLADITDRKSFELERRELHARFERVFDAAPYPSLILDTAEAVVGVNTAFTHLLGYAAADIPTLEVCFEQLFPDPAYRQLITGEWRVAATAAISGMPTQPIVARARCKQGQVRYIEWCSSRVAGETIVSLNDITGRVRAEAEQRRAIVDRDDLLRQLRLQTERMPLGVMIVDTNDELTLRGWNPAAARVFGHSREEVLGRSVRALELPERVEQVLRSAASSLDASAVATPLVAEQRRRDGSTIQCEWLITLLPDQVGRTAQVMAMVADVTERIAAEERNRMWAHVLEHSAEGIFVCDPRERILMVNTAFQQITGYSAGEAIGQTPRILSSGRHHPAFYAELWRHLSTTGKWQGEIWNRRKNQELFLEWLSISTVYDDANRVAHYVGIFSDITERKAAQERVAHLAQFDALTDLPNRLLLTDRLSQAIKSAERGAGQVGCIFVDLDRFKAINDSLGHDAGDVLLRDVASRLSATVRARDTVARMGGDEFVVVLPELRHAKDAAAVAQKLVDALLPSVALEGHEVTVTASMGIAIYPDDASNAHDLLRNADAAMYEAKAAGRNAYRFYTSDLNQRALEALSVESALRRALSRGELELHYQPQLELGSGQLIGAEALIRWRHPERGLVSPGVFIPIAEERGLIGAIGDFVLEEATQQLARWSGTPLGVLPIAINLSSLQFHQKDFVERTVRVLEARGVDPHRLELELTESIIMRDAEGTIGVLQRLHDFGLRLTIDDFGTGYSSLNYLRRFPIQKIKIDQSFVRDLAHDEDTANIVSGIIGLAKSLKLRVIAEGVETAEQLELLRARGCQEAQGFLWSPALPPAQFEAFARDRSKTTASSPR